MDQHSTTRGICYCEPCAMARRVQANRIPEWRRQRLQLRDRIGYVAVSARQTASVAL